MSLLPCPFCGAIPFICLNPTANPADSKPLPSDEIPRCPWPEQPTAPGDERDNEIATLKAKLQATAFDDWQIALRECDQLRAELARVTAERDDYRRKACDKDKP